MSFEAALADLQRRVAHYEARYETVADAEGAYLKLYNFSSKMASNLCFGRMSKIVLPYVMAIHTDDRPIYLYALPPTRREPESFYSRGARRRPAATSTLASLSCCGGPDSSSSSAAAPAKTSRRISSDDEASEESSEAPHADPSYGVDRVIDFFFQRHRDPCRLQGSASRLLVLSSTMCVRPRRRRRTPSGRCRDRVLLVESTPHLVAMGPLSLSLSLSRRPLAVEAARRVRDADPSRLTHVAHTSALNPLLITDALHHTIRTALAADDAGGAPTTGSGLQRQRASFRDRGDGGESATPGSHVARSLSLSLSQRHPPSRSYHDLVTRLESAVLDIEASVDPVLVVSHATPLRALRAYFRDIDVLHTMGQLTSEPTKALADLAPAIIELRPRMTARVTEKVIWL